MSAATTAKCPKCGWETRDLAPSEMDDVKAGRLRCSGPCFRPDPPFSPVLLMADDERLKAAKK